MTPHIDREPSPLSLPRTAQGGAACRPLARTLAKYVGSLLAIAACGATAGGAEFDPGFGVGGRITIEVGPSGNGSASTGWRTSDGRYVLAGGCTIAASRYTACATRVLPDGRIDGSFGPSGDGTFTLAGFGEEPARALQFVSDAQPLADGRIVFLGSGGDGEPPAIAVVRADGKGLDTTLGAGRGFLRVDLAGYPDVIPTRLAIQADGQLIIVGFTISAPPSTDMDFAALRVRADLSDHDRGFGDHGLARIAFNLGGNHADSAAAVEVLPDGRLLLGGSASADPASASGLLFHMAFARLLSDGQLDPLFGGSGTGRAVHGVPGTDVASANDLDLDARGNIIVTGSAARFPEPGRGRSKWMVDRLRPDGTRDPSFNGGAPRLLGLTPSGVDGDAAASRLVRDSSGGWFLIGEGSRSSASSQSMFGVVHLDAELEPHAGFGTGGALFGNFASPVAPGSADLAMGGFLDADTLVLVGAVRTDGSERFGAARLHLSALFADDFERRD